jgi:hypothetical protein
MLVIYFSNNIDPKVRVSILFLLDAVDCGYTQLLAGRATGDFHLKLCQDNRYLLGDEILDYITYIMAYKLLDLDPLFMALVALRVVATGIFALTANKYWLLVAPDAFKELVIYSWFYPLNPINITVICLIKVVSEYYYL